MTEASERRYRLAETAVVRVDDNGKGLLIDAATGSLFKLNRTCASICGAIKDEPRTLDEIMEILGQTMEMPPEASKDILSLLDVLKAKGLME